MFQHDTESISGMKLHEIKLLKSIRTILYRQSTSYLISYNECLGFFFFHFKGLFAQFISKYSLVVLHSQGVIWQQWNIDSNLLHQFFASHKYCIQIVKEINKNTPPTSQLQQECPVCVLESDRTFPPIPTLQEKFQTKNVKMIQVIKLIYILYYF